MWVLCKKSFCLREDNQLVDRLKLGSNQTREKFNTQPTVHEAVPMTCVLSIHLHVEVLLAPRGPIEDSVSFKRQGGTNLRPGNGPKRGQFCGRLAAVYSRASIDTQYWFSFESKQGR
jgi:hypothetical protein